MLQLEITVVPKKTILLKTFEVKFPKLLFYTVKAILECSVEHFGKENSA